MGFRATKIESGEYIYRGFKIYRIGYYEPEKRVVWEGVDESTQEGITRGYTKKDVMNEIDYFLEQEAEKHVEQLVKQANNNLFLKYK